MAEFESDLALLRSENSDSETLSLDAPDTIQCPLVFPSGYLLETLAEAVKVWLLLIKACIYSNCSTPLGKALHFQDTAQQLNLLSALIFSGIALRRKRSEAVPDTPIVKSNRYRYEHTFNLRQLQF